MNCSGYLPHQVRQVAALAVPARLVCAGGHEYGAERSNGRQ
jgi:hypothetical protein